MGVDTIVCGTAFAVLVILQKIMRSPHPVRSAVLCMLSGLLAMIVVNLFSPLTAVAIPVSRLSLFVSSVLGVPGVVTMLLLPLIL